MALRAVLLDALGTLVELPPPAPALAEELRARGAAVTEAEAAAAVLAEIGYYRAHLDEAPDAAGLARLRARCTDVLRDALPEGARDLPSEELQAALLAALRFRPYPEVPAALAVMRERGLRLVVVSNWDVSLHEVLARTGLDTLVDGAIASAQLGRAKPDPAPLLAGLALAGAEPHEALHVGDSVEHDVRGARAAGIEPVLVSRDSEPPPRDVRVITSLAELPGLAH
jgi:putative hydrolase of the HAD superfamily